MNALTEAREEAQRRRVAQALNETNWDVKAAAKSLGVHRTYLHRLIKRMSLIRPARLLSLEGDGECTGSFTAYDEQEGWIEVEIAGEQIFRFSIDEGTSLTPDCPWRIDRSRIRNFIAAPPAALDLAAPPAALDPPPSEHAGRMSCESVSLALREAVAQ